MGLLLKKISFKIESFLFLYLVRRPEEIPIEYRPFCS